MKEGITFILLFKNLNYTSQMADFSLSVKPDSPEGKAKHFDKQQQHIFNILTGKLRYPSVQFRDFDLTPDLIIKVTVPNSPYIPRKDYLELSNYVTLPSQRLERAFQKAQKIIIDQMNAKKENTDPSNLKIRLQKALVPSQLKIKKSKFINEYNQEEPLEFQSIYEHTSELDSFTLEYNAIIYILQHICGFRVRSFLLYDQQQQNKEIFLFLTLSAENLVNVAKRYRIKKEIDYTFIDFYLNDPIGKDQRPLKYASSVKTDKFLQEPIKAINRYFKVSNTAHETTDIIQQTELNYEQSQDFRDYMEEITQVFQHCKLKKRKQITNKQKSYIFQYNRRKFNVGCERMYAVLKQRRDFFQINKQILKKYGYPYEEEPLVYEEFHLPDKNSKQSGFFDKLYSLLLYKPMVVTPSGDLDLFLNMQRTKLAYLLVKNHFKVSYLKKMGFDFLTLSNNFEKFGQRGQVRGGINGKILQEEWSIYGIYSNIDTIRNYVGDMVGFQIMITNQLLLYFLIVFLPFSLLYIIQQVFGSSFYLYTTLMETLLYAISYQIFLFYWNLSQQEYIKNYSDSISSKIFLNEYRGPYRRNLLTDEVNQFQTMKGVWTTVMNTLCAIIIIALLVIMGAIFHGCRMLLIEIYDPLSHLVVSSISLPHVIAYLLFFVISNLAGLIATNRILAFMVNYLQNPTSDQEREDWWYILRFFYLMGLELIPPFFFFILQPFSGNSCYSNGCDSQIEFFIYSRILYTFVIQTFRLAQAFIFNYLRLKEFFRKKEAIVYQEKLSSLLSRTLKQSKKKQHWTNINEVLILVASYSIYCNVLPLISILSLVAFFMHHTNTRLGVLYEERRPINRSQKISSFLKLAEKIYYIGIILQAWVSVFLFEFVETNFQSLVQRLSTIVTGQGIFLFKIFCVFAYFLILHFLSKICGGIIKGYTNDAILRRKDNKYKQFVGNRGRMKRTIKKSYQPTPFKSMFRTFNPEKTNQEKLDEVLTGKRLKNAGQYQDDEMQVDSLINITLKHLNDK